MFFKFNVPAIACLTISACVSPADYESDPVQVASPQGAVTCQLYTQNVTSWDRSINRPETMSVETADDICRNEGKRRQ